MADEKNGKENLTEEQKAAQKAAKAFLKAKAKAVREKAAAQKEVDDLKELRTKRQKKLREAEQALESFKNDDILLALAGLEKEKDEKAYKEAAAECLFKLLAKIRKSGDDQNQKNEQNVDEKTNKKPTLQEMVVALNPAILLFPILEEVADYNEDTKQLTIDCKNLYRKLAERLAEQKKLLDDAKATYAELEKKVEAEAEAQRTKVAQARNAKKDKTADKNTNETATADASSVADEKKGTADNSREDA